MAADRDEIRTLARSMPRWRADASALKKTTGPGGHAAERAGRIREAAPAPSHRTGDSTCRLARRASVSTRVGRVSEVL
jgi:hypothetical protein